MRLINYNYNKSGSYFITFCTSKRAPILGEITDGSIVLSDIGHVADLVWLDMQRRFPNMNTYAIQIMPDHVHLLIYWKKDLSASRGVIDLICQYKSLVHYYFRKIRDTDLVPGFWQKSFHDRIIRGQGELKSIQQYIEDNPTNWI